MSLSGLYTSTFGLQVDGIKFEDRIITNISSNSVGILSYQGENEITIDTTSLGILSGGPPPKIDLSGGNNDRSTVYTTPTGITVTSSAPTWINASFYYLAYLFDGSNDQSSAATYWLTESSGDQTLTFEFPNNYEISQISVYPKTRNDASSNYSIEVSEDGVTYTEIVPTVVNDTSVPYGTERVHDNLNVTEKFIRFNLTRNGNYGITLNEIEFYGIKLGQTIVSDLPSSINKNVSLSQLGSPSTGRTTTTVNDSQGLISYGLEATLRFTTTAAGEVVAEVLTDANDPTLDRTPKPAGQEGAGEAQQDRRIWF